MRRGHLSDIEVLDLALGDPVADEASRHVGLCAECAGRVAELDASRCLAAESGMLEPDEAFWHQLHAGIRAQVARQAASARPGAAHTWWRWSLATAGAVALSVAAWSLWYSPQPPPQMAQPAWTPLSSPEDDAGFALVSEVVPAVDDETQSLVDCTACLDELTDEESRSVIEGLRTEMGRKS